MVRAATHFLAVAALAAIWFAPSPAGATTLSADASISYDGTILSITLKNTSTLESTGEEVGAHDQLIAFFFEVPGVSMLTPVRAFSPNQGVTTNTGAIAPLSGTAPEFDAGGEWGYQSGLCCIPGGYSHGISAAGLQTFSTDANFGTSPAWGPGFQLNGPQGGIFSSSYDPLNYGGRDTEYFVDEVTFEFSGNFGPNFSADQVQNGLLHFGTAPPIPEPGAATLFGIGTLVVGLALRRQPA